MKHTITIVLAILAALLAASAAHALPATIEEVAIDDIVLTPSDQGVNRLSILRGQAIDVRVVLKATDDVRNAKLRVLITDTDDIEADTESFDIDVDNGETVTRVIHLPLELPDDLDTGTYKLRLYLTDRNGQAVTQNYDLLIDTLRHDTFIKDILINPGTVLAGEELSLSARVRNAGSQDEKNVKLEFSIPGLALTGKLFIDEIDGDDDEEPEYPLEFTIPCTAKPDTYVVNLVMTYDKGRRTATASDHVTILENEAGCTPKETVVIVQQAPPPPAAPAPAPAPPVQPPAPQPQPEPDVVLSDAAKGLRGTLEVALLAVVGVLVLVGVIVGFSRLGGSEY